MHFAENPIVLLEMNFCNFVNSIIDLYQSWCYYHVQFKKCLVFIFAHTETLCECDVTQN